ncbi:MAG: hypothetical protein V3V16_01505 [Melioribacteraceae bacterium]
MKYKHLQNLLYKQFDSDLSKEEKETLEKGLSESKKLNLEKEQIVLLRNSVAKSSQKSFKPFFTERIITKINKSNKSVNEFDEFTNSLLFTFKRIAFASLLATVLLLSNNFVQADEATIESVLGFEKISIVDVFDPTLILTRE